jgi:hypothetical protein
MATMVLIWSRRSYLPRSTQISILHLVKLEVLRSRVTSTWVQTLVTLAADVENKAGRIAGTRVPMVESPVVGMVALLRAGKVEVLWAGKVELLRALVVSMGAVAEGDRLG